MFQFDGMRGFGINKERGFGINKVRGFGENIDNNYEVERFGIKEHLFPSELNGYIIDAA